MTDVLRRATSRVKRVVASPTVRWGALALALVVAVWNVERTPQASAQPILLGLAPWVVGKYLLCPLRWHAFSQSGKTRRWHMRAYAESEMLGLITPGHSGADLWRIHRLERLGMGRPNAVAEIGIDRLVGAIGLTAFVLLGGASLPAQLLWAAIGLALLLAVGGLVLARVRRDLLPRRPLPSRGAFVRGVLISIAYQGTILALLLGSVHAVGGTVDPLALMGIFGAAQVAGIIPGVHGASPREGALVVGLAGLGLEWSEAFGAVALVGLTAWGPAVLLGGTSLLIGKLAARRAPAFA